MFAHFDSVSFWSFSLLFRWFLFYLFNLFLCLLFILQFLNLIKSISYGHDLRLEYLGLLLQNIKAIQIILHVLAHSDDLFDHLAVLLHALVLLQAQLLQYCAQVSVFIGQLSNVVL